MVLMICDDEREELEAAARIVSEYARAHAEVSLVVKSFSNPFDMLDEIHAHGAPDILLLDICMPGITGVEVAREISGQSKEGTDIIFLTTSSEFAVEAFSLRAYDYLTKPYTKERLTDTLLRVVEKRRSRLFLPLLCGREIHRVDLLSVLYAEVKNHSVEVHLCSGRCLKTYTPLSEMKEHFFRAEGFLAVGASYLVNLRYVQSLLLTELEMANGDRIPVPRRLRGEVRDRYFDFYAKEAMKHDT